MIELIETHFVLLQFSSYCTSIGVYGGTLILEEEVLCDS